MSIKFLIALNAIGAFLSGIGFVLDIVIKDINEATWLCLGFFVLNILLFSVNVYRLKHKLY